MGDLLQVVCSSWTWSSFLKFPDNSTACKMMQHPARIGKLAHRLGYLYHPRMLEYRLLISVGALQSISAGNELVFALPDEDIKIILGCDESVMVAFRDAVQKAMLEFLPPAPGCH